MPKLEEVIGDHLGSAVANLRDAEVILRDGDLLSDIWRSLPEGCNFCMLLEQFLKSLGIGSRHFFDLILGVPDSLRQYVDNGFNGFTLAFNNVARAKMKVVIGSSLHNGTEFSCIDTNEGHKICQIPSRFSEVLESMRAVANSSMVNNWEFRDDSGATQKLTACPDLSLGELYRVLLDRRACQGHNKWLAQRATKACREIIDYFQKKKRIEICDGPSDCIKEGFGGAACDIDRPGGRQFGLSIINLIRHEDDRGTGFVNDCYKMTLSYLNEYASRNNLSIITTEPSEESELSGRNIVDKIASIFSQKSPCVNYSGDLKQDLGYLRNGIFNANNLMNKASISICKLVDHIIKNDTIVDSGSHIDYNANNSTLIDSFTRLCKKAEYANVASEVLGTLDDGKDHDIKTLRSQYLKSVATPILDADLALSEGESLLSIWSSIPERCEFLGLLNRCLKSLGVGSRHLFDLILEIPDSLRQYGENGLTLAFHHNGMKVVIGSSSQEGTEFSCIDTNEGNKICQIPAKFSDALQKVLSLGRNSSMINHWLFTDDNGNKQRLTACPDLSLGNLESVLFDRDGCETHHEYRIEDAIEVCSQIVHQSLGSGIIEVCYSPSDCIRSGNWAAISDFSSAACNTDIPRQFGLQIIDLIRDEYDNRYDNKTALVNAFYNVVFSALNGYASRNNLSIITTPSEESELNKRDIVDQITLIFGTPSACSHYSGNLIQDLSYALSKISDAENQTNSASRSICDLAVHIFQNDTLVDSGSHIAGTANNNTLINSLIRLCGMVEHSNVAAAYAAEAFGTLDDSEFHDKGTKSYPLVLAVLSVITCCAMSFLAVGFYHRGFLSHFNRKVVGAYKSIKGFFCSNTPSPILDNCDYEPVQKEDCIEHGSPV